MADDRHYVAGQWYFLDDRSGFKTRSSKARLQWDNVMTSGTHWNPRQPQDMVQGVLDPQAVPWARPRQTNRFVIVATWVTAHATAQSTSIQVASTVGFQGGAVCQMPLDNGNLFQFTVITAANGTLTFSPPLPSGVGGTFGDPLENTVVLISGGSVPPGVLTDDLGNPITTDQSGYIQLT